MEAQPLELHRRGASLSTVETAPGSWSVGKKPSRDLQRLSDHSNGGPELLASGRRRNSISIGNGGQDPQALRNAIRNLGTSSAVPDSQALRNAVRSPSISMQDPQAFRNAIRNSGKPIHIQAVAGSNDQAAALSRLSFDTTRKPKTLPGMAFDLVCICMQPLHHQPLSTLHCFMYCTQTNKMQFCAISAHG